MKKKLFHMKIRKTYKIKSQSSPKFVYVGASKLPINKVKK